MTPPTGTGRVLLFASRRGPAHAAPRALANRFAARSRARGRALTTVGNLAALSDSGSERADAMTQGIWAKAFPMSMVFSNADFESYKLAAERSLPFYERHLPKGARILNLGCGPGVSWIPLSLHGYRVVGIDNDLKVVEAAQKNAKTFGGDCQVISGDVFDVVELVGPDSFDACDSGGLLEHFDREQVRMLVRQQLLVAPLVMATMPVRTEATLRTYEVRAEAAEGHVDTHGIYRNFWDERTWVVDILEGFRVVEHFVERAPPPIGEFDELTVVIGRARAR